jgi:DNA-binding IclR family transcriptional regulator
MRGLRDALGHTVVLSSRGRPGLRLGTVDGSSLLRIGIVIGSPLGLHSSAQGKLVLAFGMICSKRRSRQPVSHASRTITGPGRLRREIASVRAQGGRTSDIDRAQCACGADFRRGGSVG